MDRGRILILGQSKESTYEIRKLLDNQRFELEIALSEDVGKQVLINRRMSLIMIHTEMLKESDEAFFSFLHERAIEIPVLVMGEEAGLVAGQKTFIQFFNSSGLTVSKSEQGAK